MITKLFITRLLTPARMVIGGFGCLILLGTFLLDLPVCQGAKAVGLLDCLFTATSAVCVTGLITVDTAAAWSAWGQGVILVLIQLGGLGIMTLSVALLELSGRRLSPRSHLALRGALGPVSAGEMGRMTRRVIIYTFSLEALGAVILFFRWLVDHEPGRAAALAVFHSVSAFCNAGFSLFSHNLAGLGDDGVVNATVMALVILGGMGFLVLRELTSHLPRGRHHRRPPRLSLTSRLVLITSAVLLLVGVVGLVGFEYLADGGAIWQGSWWAPLFTAVTPRTAGFNTINFGDLSNASLMLIMMLMVVGASPGSTGGGVKTTTVAVLVALAHTRLKGRPGAEVAGRSIPDDQVSSALALVIGSLTVIVVSAMFLVSIYQPHSQLGPHHQDVLTMLFEAVSAFCTVGLSLGVTPHLPALGKIILIGLMFLGRLGPLTFIYALTQEAVESRYQLAREKVLLG